MNGATVEFRVTPRSSKNRIKGVRGGVVEVALCAPPIDGRANDALVEFASELFSVPKSRISIIRGEKSRNKVLFIEGLDEKTAAAKFGVRP